MSEATKKMQELLEKGFEISARFSQGVYSVRLRKELTSSSGQIHVQTLRESGSDALGTLLTELEDGFIDFQEMEVDPETKQRIYDGYIREEASDGD